MQEEEEPYGAPPVVYVIDGKDDRHEALNIAIEEDGITIRSHATCENFLETYRPGRDDCLLIDAGVLGTGCLELIKRLGELDYRVPVIIMMDGDDLSIVVKAMKAGVQEFIEKPVDKAELLAAVHRVLGQSRDSSNQRAWQRAAANRLAALTPRQREVLAMLLDGAPNKNIATDLRISQRTVESHRAAIMRKTGSRSLPELARLALAAVARADDRRRASG